MAREAARKTDAHTCPAHCGGPITNPCAADTLINHLPAARITDIALCPGIPDPVVSGTTETVIEYLGATRRQEKTIHAGEIVVASPDTLIGKVLAVRIVIVKGSCWDSPSGREEIERQVKESERVIGLRVVSGKYETIDDPTLLDIPDGPWGTGGSPNRYSPEMVQQMNNLGSSDSSAMLFTRSIVPGPAGGQPDAITVSNAWASPADGLQHEGVIYGCGSQSDRLVFAHEIGHLLSRRAGVNDTHNEVDMNNLMWPFTGQRGELWTDPWASATEESPMLK